MKCEAEKRKVKSEVKLRLHPLQSSLMAPDGIFNHGQHTCYGFSLYGPFSYMCSPFARARSFFFGGLRAARLRRGDED